MNATLPPVAPPDDGVAMLPLDEMLRALAAERGATERALKDDERIRELVEERTAELRAACRRNDEFLARLAHEMRNPLASVASAVSLLRTDDAEEREWAADVIARQTGHLARLIEDMLEMSRIFPFATLKGVRGCVF